MHRSCHQFGILFLFVGKAIISRAKNQALHCGLGSRIRYVEVFLYKTEIKIIYFVPFCLIVLIVSDSMVYPDPKGISKNQISEN